MRKVVIFGAVCSALLVSSSASAKITPIQQYKFGELNLENDFRCEDMDGYYSSEPAGHQCSKKSFKGHECYYNCTLVCNSSDYPYTESNCVTAKHGALGGNSCTFEGITRYKTCSCSDDYTTCASPKTHSDEVCTADGEAKYKNCACPAEYQYACDGANQTGSGQSCDGRYTACNTTCPGSYNKLCDGVGEVGVGTQCGGKYQSCACASTYHTCSGNGVVGIGQACTTDGGNKYASCGCSSNYNYCASNQTGVGTPCTADGGNKYTSCETVPECSAGKILADDMNCYSQLPVGRTAIGVMFTEDLAVDIAAVSRNTSTYTAEFSTEAMSCNYSSDYSFGANGKPCNFLQGYHVGVSSSSRPYSCYCYENGQYETYKANAVTTASNPKGKTDTATFVTRFGSTSYGGNTYSGTPFHICYNKTTSGLAAHSWFLPAVGDIIALKNNLSAVNNGLEAVGGLTISNGTSSGCGVDAMNSSTPQYGYVSSSGSAWSSAYFARTGQVTYGQGNTRCIISRALTTAN